jgi:hypothetical protein
VAHWCHCAGAQFTCFTGTKVQILTYCWWNCWWTGVGEPQQGLQQAQKQLHQHDAYTSAAGQGAWGNAEVLRVDWDEKLPAEMYAQLRQHVPLVASLGWLHSLVHPQAAKMSPETLRARLLEHREKHARALRDAHQKSGCSPSGVTNSGGGSKDKVQKVLTIQGQQLVQRLVDEGLEHAAAALLLAGRDAAGGDARGKRFKGAGADGGDKEENGGHVCGKLCHDIGLWQVRGLKLL